MSVFILLYLEEHCFGLSRVRALPVVAGTNVVAIVLGIIFPSFSPISLLIYQKEDCYGTKLEHGVLIHQNKMIPMAKENILGTPPLPPLLKTFFMFFF